MAPPTSYTEDTLKAYMHADLGDVASVLGWTVAGGSYNESLSDAMLCYESTDITTISGASNIRKIRVLALYYAWRNAVGQLSARYDTSADDASLSRSQMHAMATARLADLERDAMEYLSTYEVGRDTLEWTQDPYASTAVTDAED